MKNLQNSDIVVVGAGIIGLSLALEFHARGARVSVIERDTAMSHASTAAAGMLASEDPHNPPQLLALSRLSATLYPDWLARIAQLSGIAIPFQTDTTIQYLANGEPQRLAEHSVDPRQLAASLLAAVAATSIKIREHTRFGMAFESPKGITATGKNLNLAAQRMVFTMGAWPALPRTVVPRKGQMLRVQLPSSLDLREVHRAEHIYIAPRTHGPQVGSALIGATLEDVGFDTNTHPEDMAKLRALASELIPSLADEHESPQIEAWAGLRPGTADDLPILGPQPGSKRRFLATGHFRNGILLAPATAVVMADVLEGKQPSVDLAPFAPTRF